MGRDRNALLIEMNEILGNGEQVAELESRTPNPSDVAMSFVRPGNTLVDDTVLESLAQMGWDELLQVAGFSLIPEQEVIALARSLAESTPAFREAWRSLGERYQVPAGLSRGGFITAVRISPDETILRRAVGWAARIVSEADSSVQKDLMKKMPALAKTMFTPAQDVTKQNKEKDDTERYMEPHEAGTDRPNEKKQVMTTRMFQDPEAREKRDEKCLKDIDGEIKKLKDLANRVGKEPQDMFPLLWRDLARNRAAVS